MKYHGNLKKKRISSHNMVSCRLSSMRQTRARPWKNYIFTKLTIFQSGKFKFCTDHSHESLSIHSGLSSTCIFYVRHSLPLIISGFLPSFILAIVSNVFLIVFLISPDIFLVVRSSATVVRQLFFLICVGSSLFAGCVCPLLVSRCYMSWLVSLILFLVRRCNLLLCLLFLLRASFRLAFSLCGSLNI